MGKVDFLQTESQVRDHWAVIQYIQPQALASSWLRRSVPLQTQRANLALRRAQA